MIELTLAGVVGWLSTGKDGFAAARPIFERLADEWHSKPPPNHHLAKGMWKAAVRGLHSCMQELYDESGKVADADLFNRFSAAEARLRRTDRCLLEEPVITDEMAADLERDVAGALLNLSVDRDDHEDTLASVRKRASERMWRVFCDRLQAVAKSGGHLVPPLEVKLAFDGHYPRVMSWFDHYCRRVGEELKQNDPFRRIFEGIQLAQLNERVRVAITTWDRFAMSLASIESGQQAIIHSQQAMLRELRAATSGVKPAVPIRFQGLSGVSRFKELEFFDRAERSQFHGRGRWCQEALERLSRSWAAPAMPFFGIVGESGTGKSSLLRAGLLGALDVGEVDDGSIYRTLVVTSHELTLSGPTFQQSPLGSLVDRVLNDLGRIARVRKVMSDIASSYDKPKSAVAALIRQLDELPQDGTSTKRLVIGIDQFEELLDRRGSNDGSAGLMQLFRFIRLACESGRIAILVAVQRNRQTLLEDDKNLGPLLKVGGLFEVYFPEEDEVKEIVRETFRSVGVELSGDIVDRLYSRIDELSVQSKASLLPLVSLTMRNLYRHCASIGNTLDRQSQPPPRSESEKLPVGPAQGPIHGAPGFRFKSRLRSDGVLVIETDEVPTPLLDISKAIADQADVALSEVRASPNWFDDALTTQLRRLVRIHNTDEGRLDLPPVSIPARGAARLFFEHFRQHRLLIDVAQDRVQLVHEAVIRQWPKAREWLQEEANLLRDMQLVARMADEWNTLGKPSDTKAFEGAAPALYGRVLRTLWSVFHSVDGATVSEKDLLRCDFMFAALGAAMTPTALVEDATGGQTHFLIAVMYGRVGLVRKYLEAEPDAARNHRSKHGSNAAYCAAFSGSTVMLKLVLDHGADPSLANEDGDRAIDVAAHVGAVEILHLLVARGASVTTQGKMGRTPLHLACAHGDFDVVSTLLATYGVDPNAKDETGWTPLHYACRQAPINVISLLLDQDAIDTSVKADDGASPLTIACTRGDATSVRLLLQHQATEPDTSMNSGQKPMQLAIESGSHEAVYELVQDRRVDRTSLTPGGKTLVESAIDSGKFDVLSALLDDPFGQVDPNAAGEKRDAPIIEAVRAGKKEIVDALLAAGAKANPTSGSSREGPLLIAARNGDAALVEALLPHADLNANDRYGQSALHLAAAHGHYGVVELLLEHASFARTTANGSGSLAPAALPATRLRDLRAYAAVHVAAAHGHGLTVKTFLAREPELSTYEDGIGRHLAHIAAAGGHVDLLTELVGQGEVDAPDAEHMTPLHHAAMAGRVEAVEALLSNLGANAQATDQFGWQALHLAAQNGHRQIVERLLGRDVSAANVDLLLHAAASAGQAEVLELVASRLMTRQPDPASWARALVAALTNVQLRAAISLLQRQPPNLTMMSGTSSADVVAAFEHVWSHPCANTKDLRLLRFLLLDGGFPLAEAFASTQQTQEDPSTEPSTKAPQALRLHEYAWRPAPVGLRRFLLDQLTPVDGKYHLHEDSTRVDVAPLDWYESIQLVRLTDTAWTNRDLNLYYLVSEDQQLWRLNGTSTPIHDANLHAPIRLTRDNAISYALFFTFFVRGEEGPFYCLESDDDPFITPIRQRAASDPQVAAALIAVAGTFRSASMDGIDEQGNFLVDAVIFYSNAIFIAVFLVRPNGNIDMLNDEPIASDLPFVINAPIA